MEKLKIMSSWILINLHGWGVLFIICNKMEEEKKSKHGPSFYLIVLAVSLSLYLYLGSFLVKVKRKVKMASVFI